MRLGRDVKYKTLMSLVYDTINVLQLAHVAVRAPAHMHTPGFGLKARGVRAHMHTPALTRSALTL